MTGEDLPPDELLAMELALGLLEGSARAAAEARRATDPAFAARVRQWEENLLPLADELEPVAPPPALWERIDAAVEADSRVVAPAHPSPCPAARLSWWDRLPLWRGATAALAALSLALLVTRPEPVPPAPAPRPAGSLLAATLASEGGSRW